MQDNISKLYKAIQSEGWEDEQVKTEASLRDYLSKPGNAEKLRKACVDDGWEDEQVQSKEAFEKYLGIVSNPSAVGGEGQLTATGAYVGTGNPVIDTENIERQQKGQPVMTPAQQDSALIANGQAPINGTQPQQSSEVQPQSNKPQPQQPAPRPKPVAPTDYNRVNYGIYSGGADYFGANAEDRNNLGWDASLQEQMDASGARAYGDMGMLDAEAYNKEQERRNEKFYTEDEWINYLHEHPDATREEFLAQLPFQRGTRGQIEDAAFAPIKKDAEVAISKVVSNIMGDALKQNEADVQRVLDRPFNTPGMITEMAVNRAKNLDPDALEQRLEEQLRGFRIDESFFNDVVSAAERADISIDSAMNMATQMIQRAAYEELYKREVANELPRNMAESIYNRLGGLVGTLMRGGMMHSRFTDIQQAALQAVDSGTSANYAGANDDITGRKQNAYTSKSVLGVNLDNAVAGAIGLALDMPLFGVGAKITGWGLNKMVQSRIATWMAANWGMQGAQKACQAYIMSALSESGLSAAVAENVPKWIQASYTLATSAGSFAGYNALTNPIDQYVMTGEVDLEDYAKEVGRGVIDGAVFGAIGYGFRVPATVAGGRRLARQVLSLAAEDAAFTGTSFGWQMWDNYDKLRNSNNMGDDVRSMFCESLLDSTIQLALLKATNFHTYVGLANEAKRYITGEKYDPSYLKLDKVQLQSVKDSQAVDNLFSAIAEADKVKGDEGQFVEATKNIQNAYLNVLRDKTLDEKTKRVIASAVGGKMPLQKSASVRCKANGHVVEVYDLQGNLQDRITMETLADAQAEARRREVQYGIVNASAETYAEALGMMMADAQTPEGSRKTFAKEVQNACDAVKKGTANDTQMQRAENLYEKIAELRGAVEAGGSTEGIRGGITLELNDGTYHVNGIFYDESNPGGVVRVQQRTIRKNADGTPVRNARGIVQYDTKVKYMSMEQAKVYKIVDDVKRDAKDDRGIVASGDAEAIGNAQMEAELARAELTAMSMDSTGRHWAEIANDPNSSPELIAAAKRYGRALEVLQGKNDYVEKARGEMENAVREENKAIAYRENGEEPTDDSLILPVHVEGFGDLYVIEGNDGAGYHLADRDGNVVVTEMNGEMVPRAFQSKDWNFATDDYDNPTYDTIGNMAKRAGAVAATQAVAEMRELSLPQIKVGDTVPYQQMGVNGKVTYVGAELGANGEPKLYNGVPRQIVQMEVDGKVQVVGLDMARSWVSQARAFEVQAQAEEAQRSKIAEERAREKEHYRLQSGQRVALEDEMGREEYIITAVTDEGVSVETADGQTGSFPMAKFKAMYDRVPEAEQPKTSNMRRESLPVGADGRIDTQTVTSSEAYDFFEGKGKGRAKMMADSYLADIAEERDNLEMELDALDATPVQGLTQDEKDAHIESIERRREQITARLEELREQEKYWNDVKNEGRKRLSETLLEGGRLLDAPKPGVNDVTGLNIAEKSPELMSLAEQMGNDLGVEIAFVRQDSAYNGKYENGRIYVALDAYDITPERIADTRAKVVMAALGHEANHRMHEMYTDMAKMVNPLVEKYLKSKTTTIERDGKRTEMTLFDYHYERKSKQYQTEASGAYKKAVEEGKTNLSKEEFIDNYIREEMSGDLFGELLLDPDFAKRLTGIALGESDEMPADEARGMIERVRQFVSDAINKVRKYINGDAKAEKALEELKNMWEEAYNRIKFETDIARNGGVIIGGETIDTPDGGSIEISADNNVRASLKSREDERMYLDAVYNTNAGSLNREEIEDMRTVGDAMMEGVLGIMAHHPAFEDWNMRTVLTDKKGNPVYSVFINNSDTEAPTIELSRNCVKKEAMNELLTILRNEGNLHLLDNISYLDLRELLKKHGYAIACEMCYVESRRENVETKRRLGNKWNAVAEQIGLTDDILTMDGNVELTDEQKTQLQKIIAKEKKWLATHTGNRFNAERGEKHSNVPKIAELMLRYPELRGKMDYEAMYTPGGWEELLTRFGGDHPFMSWLSSHDGSTTAKPTFGSHAFSQEKFVKDYGELTKWFGEAGMRFGGFRKHSFSDADPLLFVDDFQIHENLALTKSGMFGYTKVPYYVDMWGETGEFINQSLVLDIDTEGAEARKYAGLIKVGDSRHQRALKMTDAEYEAYKAESGLQDGDWDYYYAEESFPVKEAMAFRKEGRFGGRVGNVLVAPSDECIRRALDDERIDVIIGWHSSNKLVTSKERTGYDHATDYGGRNSTNETRGNDGTTSNTYLESMGVIAPTYISDKKVKFNYNEACQELGDARTAADAYLAWCDLNGFTPMYEQFREHPNYYKLLNDFRRYDNEGNALVQGAISVKLPENWAEKLDGYVTEREAEYGKNTVGLANDASLLADVHRALGIKERDSQVVLAQDSGEVNRASKKLDDGSELTAVDNADGTKDIEIKAPDGVRYSIKTWHGSAADFDKFDHRFFHTGEGSMVYGAGTYVSNVEGTARMYAEIADSHHGYDEYVASYRGKDIWELVEDDIEKEPHYTKESTLRMLNQLGEDAETYGLDKLPRIYEERIAGYEADLEEEPEDINTSMMLDLVKRKYDYLKKGGIEVRHDKSLKHLYEVEIPDDNGHNYIDWNENPTKEQLQRVGRALSNEDTCNLLIDMKWDKEEGIRTEDSLYDMVSDRLRQKIDDKTAEFDEEQKAAIFVDWFENSRKGESGKDLYAVTEMFVKDKVNGEEDVAISNFLSDAGFTGVKVPTGNTRGGDGRGMNYVIFNENNAQIVGHERFSKKDMVGERDTRFDDVIARVVAPEPYPNDGELSSEGKAAMEIYGNKELIRLRGKIKDFGFKVGGQIGNVSLGGYESDGQHKPTLNASNARWIGESMVSLLGNYKSALERIRDEKADGRPWYTRRFNLAIADVDKAIEWYEEFAKGKHPDVYDHDEEGIRYSQKAKAGTLFSGAGTLEQGLKDVIEPRFAAEWDEKIRGVYRDNNGDHWIFPDVNEIGWNDIIEATKGGNSIQYLHASPVCKAFSGAHNGRQVSEGEMMRDMHFAESVNKVLAMTQPAVFTLENVPAYLASKPYERIKNMMTALGYSIDEGIYDASNYGAATSRKRLIVRAVKNGTVPPRPAYTEKTSWLDRLHDFVGSDEFVNGASVISREEAQQYLKDYHGELKEDEAYLVLGKQFGEWSVRRADEPAPTILANKGNKEFILMPTFNGEGSFYMRELPTRQLAQLQGLSDDFKLPKSDTLAHTVIGNGIPVELTKAVIAPLIQTRINQRQERKVATQRIENKYDELAQQYIPEFNRGSALEDKIRKLFDEYVVNMADDNIVPFLSPNMNYKTKAVSKTAHAIKGEKYAMVNGVRTLVPISPEAQQEAIDIAASQMAPMVPKDAVLVPIPSRTGKATDTKMLAEAISKLTGAPVADVLTGLERRSMYEQKKKGGYTNPEMLGFRMEGDVPEGKRIIFIDNVIDRGNTAAAAVRACKGGTVLSYAYAGEVQGNKVPLRSAELVTYDDHGQVIPLNERFNPNNAENDIRFSQKDDNFWEMDDFDEVASRNGLNGVVRGKSSRLGGYDDLKPSEIKAIVSSLSDDKRKELERTRRAYMRDYMDKTDVGSWRNLSQRERNRIQNEANVRALKEVAPDAIYRRLRNPESDIQFGNDKFSKKIEDTDPFYSNAAKTVEGIRQEKATPDQWLAMITKNGGLKVGEDKWMGLSEWLKDGYKKDLYQKHIIAAMIELNDGTFIRQSDLFDKGETAVRDAVKYNFELSAEAGYIKAEDIPVLVDKVMRAGNIKNITKEELQQFISENAIKIEEVHYKEGENAKAVPEEVKKLWWDALEQTNYHYALAWQKFLEEDPTLAEDYDVDEEGDIVRISSKLGEINPTRLNYTTEGLDNNREIALTVPTVDPYNESDDVHFGDAGEGRAVVWVRFGDATTSNIVEGEKAYEDYRKMLVGKYGENVLTDPAEYCTPEEISELNRLYNAYNGNSGLQNRQKVLVIDEVQSKRHQDGREMGYDNIKDLTLGEFKDVFGMDRAEIFDSSNKKVGVVLKSIRSGKYYATANGRTTSEFSTPEEALNAFAKTRVPDAPFDKNWMELGMKRMLRYAAENGYDKVAWTTGEQQAERYGIGRVVNSIETDPTAVNEHRGEPVRDVTLYMNNGETALYVDKNGTVVDYEGASIGFSPAGTPLADIIGKELANKMLNATEFTRAEGTDLMIGGEGMKGFYDKMIPSFMSKYGKKWGAKVGEVELDLPNEADRKMWSVDVTPEMKESVMQGQAMFSKKIEEADPFYSNAAKAVEDIRQEKATPDQWLAMITKNGGLKAGEDKWMGLSEWLTKQKALAVIGDRPKTITKQEVMDFINQNAIKVEEVHYSENGKMSDEQFNSMFDELPPEVEDFHSRMQDEFGLLREEGMNFDEAYEEMNKRYGDMFEEAYPKEDQDKDTDYIQWSYLDPLLVLSGYKSQLGETNEDKAIHSTRMTYTTRGLDNKREIALTIPTIEPYNENDTIHFGDAGEGRAVVWVRFGDTQTGMSTPQNMEVESRRIMDELSRKYGSADNVDKMTAEDKALRELANDLYRYASRSIEDIQEEMNDASEGMKKFLAQELEEKKQQLERISQHYDTTGQKVLVIDEVQSKRHQDGREKGYKESRIELEKRLRDARNEYREFEYEMQDKYPDYNYWESTDDYKQGMNEADYNRKLELKDNVNEAYWNLNHMAGKVPDAPFDKNWMELGMKRMLRYAAENGYDKVAWTTGKQQSERYNLSKFADAVTSEFDGEHARIEVSFLDHDMQPMTMNVNRKTGMVEGSDLYPDATGDPVGKNLGDIIGKELADKVLSEEGSISGKGLVFESEGMKGFYDKMIPSFMSKYGKKWGAKVGEVELDLPNEADRKMWSVDVTPEMKESVMQGQAMFSKKDADSTDNYDPTNPDIRYSMKGVKGAERLDAVDGGTRIADLSVAEEMEKAKKDARTIKMATGWERGADGKWRHESMGVQFKEGVLGKRWGGNITLADIVDSDWLFDAYPEFRDVKVKRESRSGYAGSFVSSENTMKVKTKDYTDWLERVEKYDEWIKYYEEEYAKNPTEEIKEKLEKYRKSRSSCQRIADTEYMDMLDTLNHELQHVIQEIEGFAKGGSPSYDAETLEKADPFARCMYELFGDSQFPLLRRAGSKGVYQFLERAVNAPGAKDEAIYTYYKFLYDHWGERSFESILDGTRTLAMDVKQNGKENYRRLAGEVEARNAGKRMRYTEEELRNTLIADTEDIARKEQIVRFKTEANNNLVDYAKQKVAERRDAEIEAEATELGDSDTRFSKREKPAPKKTGIGYKVFYRGKDGKLYPPMVANPNGADTPAGVWLDADAAPVVGTSKTGRPQVKQGGKGTQGGSGQLAYRPGWHLGEIPYALQFNRKDANGNKTLFPKDFVWAEVEYAADKDYQAEAEKEGYTENGKFRHAYAGLKRLPEDGYYRYRTNPNPETDPWIITGAMKVNRILDRAEVDDLVRKAGREPQVVEGDGNVRHSSKWREPQSVEEYVAQNWLAPNPESLEREFGLRSSDRRGMGYFIRKNGQDVRRVSEMIYDELRGTGWGEQVDDTDIFNIIGDIIQAGGPAKYLRGIYEKEEEDLREYEESMQEQFEAERDDWYQENLGISYGDYLDWQMSKSRSVRPSVTVNSSAVGDAQKALVQQIQSLMRDEYLSTADKREVSRLANLVRFATPEKLAGLVDAAKLTITDMRQKALARQIAKTLQLKVQDVNGRNMSIAKNVDDATRQVIGMIGGNIRQMAENEVQLALSDVNKQLYGIRRELRTLETVLERDEPEGAEHMELESRIEQCYRDLDRLTEERRELRSQLAEAQAEATSAAVTDIAGKIAELETKFNDHLDGKGKWTTNDEIALTAYKTLEKQTAISQMDTTIKSINDQIVSAMDGKAPKNQIDALRHELLLAKEERANRQEEFLQTVNDLIETGKNNLLERTRQELQRKREMVNGIFEDIATDKTVTDKDRGEKNRQGILHSFFFSALESFDYMSNFINKRTMSGDGWFRRTFMEGEHGVVAARSEFLRNKHEGQRVLNDKSMELFGKSYDKVLEENGKEVENTGIHLYETTDDMEVIDRGEIALSKGAATYFYMVWKMGDGRATMEHMGFTEQSVAQIKEFIGDANVRWADWVQDEFLPERRERYNDKYVEIYGTSMAKIDNYVPLRRSGVEIRKETDLNTGQDAYSATVNEKVRSLINRTFNVKPIDITTNAFEVIATNLNEMEEFYAYADVRRDLSNIFSSTAVRNQLNANDAGSFDALLQAAQVATMVTLKDDAPQPIDRAVAKLTKGIVGANIAFRLGTAIKQTESSLAYFGYSANPRFLGRLAFNVATENLRNLPGVINGVFGKNRVISAREQGRAMSGLSSAFEWCLHNVPSFRERVTGKEIETSAVSGSFADGNKGVGKRLGEITDKAMAVGMYANQMIDAVTCCIGIKSIYDYKMAKAKRTIDAEMKVREAELDAEMEQKIARLKQNLAQFGNEGAEGVKTEADVRREYADKKKQERQQKMDEAHRRAIMDADIFYNGTQQSSHPAFMSPMQTSSRALQKALTAYQNSPISFMRKTMTAIRDLSDVTRFNKTVDTYARVYQASGMAEADARKEAKNRVWNRLAGAVGSLLVFGAMVNFGWKLMGTGTFGFNKSEEQTDDLLNPANYPYYFANGTAGTNMVNGILQLNTNSPLFLWEEVDGMCEKVKKIAEKQGVLSPEMITFIATKLTRMGGVDLNTIGNIVLAVDDRIQKGASLQEIGEDFEFLISLSETNRLSSVKEMYAGSNDMTFDDYVAAVLRAGKYFDADDWRRWVPNSKALSEQKFKELMTELDEKWKTAHGDSSAREARERKEAIKEAKTVEELIGFYDSSTDKKERESLKKKIKAMSGSDDASMDAMIEDWKKDQTDTGGSTPAKPLDAGKAIMNQYGTYDDLQMGQKVDAKIKSLKAVKDRASAIKDPQEKKAYELEHKAELDKYDKLYNMRSGNNYDSGNYESVNDYLKAIAEGKISQTEGFAKIREIRKQILAE